MTAIRIRLIRDKTLFSRLICWYTQSKWSHVEFVTPSGYLSALPQGGVKIRAFDYALPIAEEFREIEVDDAAAKEFWAWVYSQVGKPYDWSAIFGLILHHNWRNQNCWFCSELITRGYEIAGIKILCTDHVNYITPRDVGLSTVLKKDI